MKAFIIILLFSNKKFSFRILVLVLPSSVSICALQLFAKKLFTLHSIDLVAHKSFQCYVSGMKDTFLLNTAYCSPSQSQFIKKVPEFFLQLAQIFHFFGFFPCSTCCVLCFIILNYSVTSIWTCQINLVRIIKRTDAANKIKTGSA